MMFHNPGDQIRTIEKTKIAQKRDGHTSNDQLDILIPYENFKFSHWNRIVMHIEVMIMIRVRFEFVILLFYYLLSIV